MKDIAKAGDWVQIYQVVLLPEERAPQLPEETKKVPLELRTKGFLVDDEAQIGMEVTIQTIIGRKLKGRLEAINPEFNYSFGRAVPELLPVGAELRALLNEGGK
jgi:hypothetical protein